MTPLPLAPRQFELVSVTALVVFYLAGLAVLGEELRVVNAVGPIVLACTLCAGAYAMLRLDSRTLFTPLFGFRVACAIYFGFGSLVHMAVNEEWRDEIESLYSFTEVEVARLNLCVALSVLVILLVARLAGPTAVPPARPLDRSNRLRLLQYGAVLLVAGSIVKYALYVPVAAGWRDVGDVPGFVLTLADCSLIGINLLTIWCLTGARAYLPLIAGIVALEMFVGLLLAIKFLVLLPLIMFLTALIHHRMSLARVVIAFVCVAAVVEWMQPFVAYARDAIVRHTEANGAGAGFRIRLGILGEYLASDARHAQKPGVGLIRISYINAGTFAMSMYDRGYPGDSYRNVLVALVPRVLWPDKPLLLEGREFSGLATGYDFENSVSPGLFAEAYWNFGWLGVPFIMVFVAAFLVAMSRYSLWVVASGRWLYFPIALIGLRTGLGIDGMFVGLLVGTMVTILGLHLLAAAADGAITRLFHARRGAAGTP